MSECEWMHRVNWILRKWKWRRGDVYVRFVATKVPKPTIAIAIYYAGRKTLELPIKDLETFAKDLEAVLTYLRSRSLI